MLTLETTGSWRQMGEQLGEAFRHEIREAQELFAPWLVTEPDKYAPAVARVRGLLADHAPELLAEAEGMAAGARLPEDVALGYRYFNQLSVLLQVGCSAIFLRDTPEGPLLGRNCDLGPAEIKFQLCQVRRPTGQPVTVETTYVGLACGPCLNEFGLGWGGASAPATVVGDTGLPSPVLLHWLIHECRTVAEARQLLARHAFLGKAANIIVGDASGDSALYEFIPGVPPVEVPPEADGSWQACTNFRLSDPAPWAPGPAYAANAYARYGRISHMLGHGLAERSREGLHGLLCDIAQVGPVCPEQSSSLRTAYSQILDLRARTMYLWRGHPATTDPLTIALRPDNSA